MVTEGKNVSSGGGWAQLRCPLCGDPSHHLGFNQESNSFKCWRCGKRSAKEIMPLLSPLPWKEICRRYISKSTVIMPKERRQRRPDKGIILPKDFKPLQDQHKKYMADRGFDWQRIEKEYSVLGTGPLGKWKNRIIIPVIFKGSVVTYTSRDITGRSDERYKACPGKDEGRNIKDCLYSLDKVKGDSVVVVEGPTDVWRLGEGTVATFGVEVSAVQKKLLKDFKHISILFDPEAGEEAEKLADDLALFSDVEIVTIKEDDPGELTDRKAKRIMQRLLRR